MIGSVSYRIYLVHSYVYSYFCSNNETVPLTYMDALSKKGTHKRHPVHKQRNGETSIDIGMKKPRVDSGACLGRIFK